MKVFRPSAFQGSLASKNYFEGWYFKHVSADLQQVWSFIPGISLTPGDRHAFIQVINGLNGEAWQFRYPLSAFASSRKQLNVRIAGNHFSPEGIVLDLENDQTRIKGEISYSGWTPYPATPFRPGIMGWYSFVPLMECKHGICSMVHGMRGGLEVDSRQVDLSGGTGYVEKDWGRSFPESWVWLHCNTFSNGTTSFTFSVAKIPWLGSHFIGFISYLRTGEAFYNFSTWSGARIDKLASKGDRLHLVLSRKDLKLEVQAVNSLGGSLKAPVRGSMERMIKESIDAKLSLELRRKGGGTVYRGEGQRCGMELIDPILDYF